MNFFRIPLLILALSLGFYGQQGNCRFSVPVHVTDAKSLEPLIGFGTDSFQIKVGHQRLQSSAVAYQTADRVFLFIDASGSMRRNWAVVMQTAHELFTTIDTKVPLTTEVFAVKSRSFTYRDEAYSFLKYLSENKANIWPIGGRTELFDYIAAAVDSEHIGMGDAVIVITDGVDNLSKIDNSKLMRELADHAVHPAFLLPSLESDLQSETIEEQVAKVGIPRMAEGLGGFVFYLPRTLSKKPEQILPLRFYAEALAYYRVSFEASPGDKQRLKVTILKNPSGNIRKFEVHAPNRLPACTVPQ